jgi:hypothetical protein
MTPEERQREAVRLSQEEETMYITIGIAGGCGAALVAVAVIVTKKAMKSKAALPSNRNPGPKAMTPKYFAGGISSNNPSFLGNLPEACTV